MLLQLTDRGQRVHRVAGKAADRFRYNEVDLACQCIGNHLLEAFAVLRAGAGDTLIYLNAVFDTNGKAFSGAQSAGKGLISWAFAVLPVYPTGLRKPCFSFQ